MIGNSKKLIGYDINLFSNNNIIIYDTDATAFFLRVTAAGGSLTINEKLSVNNLVISLKQTSNWNNMLAIYPMVGSTANSCSQNLKSASFTGIFNGGWNFASTGVTPNGTNAYLNTNFLPSISSINNNTHISFYSRSEIQIDSQCLIGSAKNTIFIPLITIYGRSTIPTIMDSYSYSSNRISYSPTTSKTFFINTRTSNFLFNGYNNSLLIGTNTTSQIQNIQTCNLPIYIGAINLNGIANQFSANECAFASIGLGLNNTNVINFNNTILSFQTSLNRQN